MNKKEKLNKLLEISSKLKSEFVGISETIDSLVESITPWYITPELIERPVVVSLWGLTGTGKTSVIRKLVEYLDLLDRTLFFDCGAEENTDNSISDKVCSFFENSSRCLGTSTCRPNEISNVFVFDEFQYSRTIDEDGREVSKSSQRSIWNLLDSGIIDVVARPWEVKELIVFSEELSYLMDDLGKDLRITKGIWPESVLPKIKATLDFYKSWDDTEDEKEDKSNPILSKNKKDSLVSRLNSFERGLGYKTIGNLERATTLGEFQGILEESVRVISRPKRLDCSKSIVFVIGNLDEAFSGCGDLDPDMDADVFAKVTKETGILDVKEALKERFRVEQIGRLGNNMIIYPSLSKSDFMEIIERELSRISENFKSVSGIQVTFDESFKKLLYSEGVFPSQGTRPVFTTVNTLCLPKLSKILSEAEEGETSAKISVSGEILSSEVDVIITMSSGKSFDLKEKLNLGSLRGKDSCEKIAAHAVHEAGHAIMMTLEKGDIPEMILAQSSLGGGYTYGSLDKKDKLSAMSRQEVVAETRIALAGTCAEHIFFDDQYCTIGCTSDFQEMWTLVSKAAYRGGLFNDPWPWFCESGPEGMPLGHIDYGSDTSKVTVNLENFFRSQYRETTSLLRDEKLLIVELSKVLIKNRCMFSEEYKSILEKYGTEKIKERASKKPENYWMRALGL